MCSVDSRVLCSPCSQQEIAVTPIVTHAVTHSRIALHCDLLVLLTPAVTHSLTQWPFYRPTLNFPQRPTLFRSKNFGTWPGTASFGLVPSETRTNGTASRHQGPKTGTTNSSNWHLEKSPLRSALPGAVGRVWGGSPIHTLSPVLNVWVMFAALSHLQSAL